MLDRIKMVKRKMDESLEQLCEVSWMFSRQPEKDFTRNRKLSFPKLVSFLLAMEGGTLTTELLKRFGCSPDTASASAFVQQRSKLAPENFPSLFDLFVRKTLPLKLYKGFRLFAADGSDIQIPNNPGHISSHYCENTYPWTRLGYTYDWAENGEEYGLSEFLLTDGAEVTVEFTKTLEEFLRWAGEETKS